MNNPIKTLFSIGLIPLLLAQCSGFGQNEIGSTFEPSFELKEVQQFSLNDDMGFGSISNILVTSKGTILVSDGSGPMVYQFDNSGKYLGSIGDYGSEVGQFEGVPVVSLFENDSLLIWDRDLQKALIYSAQDTSWAFVREFTVNRFTQDGYMVNNVVKFEGWGGYLTHETKALSEETVNDTTFHRYQRINEANEIIQPNLLTRRNQEWIIDNDNGNSVLPFGRNSFVRFDKDGSYYVGKWNDQLDIRHLNIDGATLNTITQPVKTRNISEDDKKLDPRTANPNLQDKLPTTHPAYVAFVVSDKGNIWVNIGQINAESTYWVVIDAKNTVLGSTLLPAQDRPARIVNGKLYAARQSSNTKPEIVVYETSF